MTPFAFFFRLKSWQITGSDLPRRYGEFPLELASTPICDIDPYYHDKKTFIVISKGLTINRWGKRSNLCARDRGTYIVKNTCCETQKHVFFNIFFCWRAPFGYLYFIFIFKWTRIGFTEIDSGMVLAPLTSSILDERRFEPITYRSWVESAYH